MPPPDPSGATPGIPPRPVILVVDDDAAVRRALVRLLARAFPGAVLHQADSGDRALAWLREHPVDLVLSDYRMPGLNGVEFLKALDGIARDVPRVLVTAYPDLDLAVAACNDARVGRFIMKPWRKEDLVATVTQLLVTRREQQAAMAHYAQTFHALQHGHRDG